MKGDFLNRVVEGVRARRNVAAMAIGSAAFCVVGLVLMPGLIQRAPTPVPNDSMHDSVVADMPASDSTPPAPMPADPIDSLAPSSGNPSAHSFDCIISANETIQVSSPILGLIDSIYVERSDYVEAGQPLAMLESSVEAAAVRVAEARAARMVEVESTKVSRELGKKRSKRARDLFEGASMSLDLREEIETEAELAKLGVEQAEEDHRLAVLQLEQARATLERRTLRSPVSGYVVERLMSPGEVVDRETILTVAQIDPLRIEMILPTHLFGAVLPGDPIEITPEAPLDQPRVAKVEIVDRILDGASGTFGVRLLLPNPDHAVPGGLRCQARLLDRESEGLADVADEAELASAE